MHKCFKVNKEAPLFPKKSRDTAPSRTKFPQPKGVLRYFFYFWLLLLLSTIFVAARDWTVLTHATNPGGRAPLWRAMIKEVGIPHA